MENEEKQNGEEILEDTSVETKVKFLCEFVGVSHKDLAPYFGVEQKTIGRWIDKSIPLTKISIFVPAFQELAIEEGKKTGKSRLGVPVNIPDLDKKISLKTYTQQLREGNKEQSLVPGKIDEALNTVVSQQPSKSDQQQEIKELVQTSFSDIKDHIGSLGSRFRNIESRLGRFDYAQIDEKITVMFQEISKISTSVDIHQGESGQHLEEKLRDLQETVTSQKEKLKQAQEEVKEAQQEAKQYYAEYVDMDQKAGIFFQQWKGEEEKKEQLEEKVKQMKEDNKNATMYKQQAKERQWQIKLLKEKNDQLAISWFYKSFRLVMIIFTCLALTAFAGSLYLIIKAPNDLKNAVVQQNDDKVDILLKAIYLWDSIPYLPTQLYIPLPQSVIDSATKLARYDYVEKFQQFGIAIKEWDNENLLTYLIEKGNHILLDAVFRKGFSPCNEIHTIKNSLAKIEDKPYPKTRDIVGKKLAQCTKK